MWFIPSVVGYRMHMNRIGRIPGRGLQQIPMEGQLLFRMYKTGSILKCNRNPFTGGKLFEHIVF